MSNNRRSKSRLLRYDVHAIPDAGDPAHRVMAAGDVVRAVRDCHEHLLRTLVTYPAGSSMLALRWTFTPAGDCTERQSRLSLSVIVRAEDREVARSLRVLLECSDLRAYYDLGFSRGPRACWARYRACCDITRGERAVEPLHQKDANPAIPSLYYLCDAFSPRADNDYLTLDRVLDRVDEPVLFEIAVEPVDLSAERRAHAQGIAALQSINRPHEAEDEDGEWAADPFEAGPRWRTGNLTVVGPLRHKDPLADDILRERRRFHEGLNCPHLRFHMRVLAHTPASAQLVASVVAESAFRDGSYSLWPVTARNHCFHQVLTALATGRVHTQATLDRVFGQHARMYCGFERLAHVATVEQLLGVFTMPVAGRGALRCLRKNTEPVLVPNERLLVMGHDE